MKQEDSVLMHEDIKDNYYVGGYNIVKSYTSFDSIRIFSANMNGCEIHAHPEFEIIMVIEGTLKVETEGSIYNMFEMDVLIVNSDKYHILEGNESTEIVILQIKDGYITSFFNDDNVHFNNFYSKKNNYQLSTSILNLLLNNYREPDNHKLIEKYLVVILNSLDINTESMTAKKVFDLETREIVLRVVEDLSRDNTLTLESLASKYHISYSHLSREFLNVLGLHFTEYVRHIRINYAVHRLLNTDLSQTDVAFESGFSNSQVFSRTFKEFFKQTPSQFRNTNKDAITEDLPKEFIHRLERKVRNLEQIKNDSINQVENYNLDVLNPPFYKANKSLGKIVDLNQLSRGDFYIADLLKSLERFSMDYLRIDFELIDGVYCPIFKSLTDRHLIKHNFNDLMSAINQRGIKLLLRIRVKKGSKSYEESLLNHSEALEKLLNYVSLKLGLKNLRDWAYELYVEDFNLDHDFDWLHDFSLGMVDEVCKKIGVNDLDWGINLGVHEDFQRFESIVRLLDQSFNKRKPVFLSLHCIIKKEYETSANFNHMCHDTQLSALLEGLPYEYLLDLTYKMEDKQFQIDPLKEAAYCIHLIKGMLRHNVDFQLVSWSLEDQHEKKMGMYYDDKGIETISYYLSYLMSKLYDNLRFIDPGLIVSSDQEGNYNMLMLSLPDTHIDFISKSDISKKRRKQLNVSFDNISGNYKIIETRVPIETFSKHHAWLSVLDVDALSQQEKKSIRNKVSPELMVSLDELNQSYQKNVTLNQLDLMLIEMKKL